MKMKKYGIFALMVLLISIMSTAAYAVSEASLGVSVARYEPDPVEPGSYFDIWFKVDNIGGDIAKNATLIFEPSFPFTTDDATVNVIGLLNQLDSSMVKYRIRVHENAVEGVSKLNIKYSANPSKNIIISNSFDVHIQTFDADINLVSMSTIPSQLLPGSHGEVRLIFKNTADSLLKNVKVTMDLSGVAIPFAPMGKSTTNIIKNMAGGEETIIVFEIIAKPDALSGIYKVPVTITFSDNVGNDYTRSEIVSIVIGGVPDLLTYVESDTLFLSGYSGDIRVNIVNKGLVDVKAVTVKVLDTDEFELLSNDEIYIGNIDSDDFDSAGYTIHVPQTFSGELSVPVRINYMSANNDVYEVYEDLIVRVYTLSEAQSLGLVAKSSATTIYVLLFLFMLGYIVYKKRKNKKNK
ncbi:MAG: hypothetical protein K0B07_01465 [DPANN group archaeon]|nr:hypothetical protein [DPANN group archaeon]